MKKLLTKKTISAVLGGLAILLLFLLATYASDRYSEDIKLFVSNDGVLGMLGYVFITALAIVIAPISTLPLIPLASMLWGWFVSGLLSILGWIIGSQIAFLLARHYGKPLIEKFVSFDQIKKFEKKLPTKNIFWVIVLLRMTVPVDVLSYAVGLFSEIKSIKYFWATLIGVTPFAFIFAYTGTLSIGMQVIAFIEVSLLLFIVYMFKRI